MRTALKKLQEMIKKHGVGMVIVAATLDGYRRQLLKEKSKNQLDQIEAEKNKLAEDGKAAYTQRVSEMAENSKNKATMAKFKEAADELKKEAEGYSQNPFSKK